MADAVSAPEGLTLRSTIEFDGRRIRSVAWHPDGRRLAVGYWDGRIIVWDAESATRLWERQAHRDIVHAVAWAPGGSLLASSSKDGTLQLRRDSGEAVDTGWRHDGSVLSVSWAPAGTRLVSGSADRTVRVWDATDASFRRTLPGHADYVQSVAWSPDGRYIASGSNDQTIRLWDSVSEAGHWQATGHSGIVKALTWKPGGALLASGGFDRTVRLWDVPGRRPMGALWGHAGVVASVSFSRGGALLASKATDETVRLWWGDAWEQTASFPETISSAGSPFFCLAFHPNVPRLATLGGKDTIVRIWDVDAASLRSRSAAEGEATPDGSRLTPILVDKKILRASEAVGLILVPRIVDGVWTNKVPSGTGWLLAPGLVLTCWHVLTARLRQDGDAAEDDVRAQVREAVIQFGHLEPGQGVEYGFEALESSDSDLDYALLRVRPRNDFPLGRYGYLRRDADAPLKVYHRLLVLQHPRGQPKHQSTGPFRGEGPGATILYEAPTEPGASGAPVLNYGAGLGVVAMHRRESPRPGLREGVLLREVLAHLRQHRAEVHDEILRATHEG